MNPLNESVESITLEKFKQALEGFKSFKIEPYKCFYCNYKIQTQILRICYNQPYPEIVLVGGIDLIVDNAIEENTIIYCEPGLYDIWKQLKASPWIDKNDKTIDLWKVADSIFQNNKQQKVLEWPELIIEPTFSVGHLFPTGATIKGLKINRADLPPIKL